MRSTKSHAENVKDRRFSSFEIPRNGIMEVRVKKVEER